MLPKRTCMHIDVRPEGLTHSAEMLAHGEPGRAVIGIDSVIRVSSAFNPHRRARSGRVVGVNFNTSSIIHAHTALHLYPSCPRRE